MHIHVNQDAEPSSPSTPRMSLSIAFAVTYFGPCQVKSCPLGAVHLPEHLVAPLASVEMSYE